MSTPGPPLLPRIERELEQRLAQLDAERAAIRRALRALRRGREGGAGGGRRRLTDEALLAALRADPGARASLLALELGAPADAVAQRLERLRAEGHVVREGLGWRARAADEGEVHATDTPNRR